MDSELRQFLDSYTVEKAGDKLLDTIVEQARQSKVVELPLRRWTHMRQFRAAAYAAVAVIGFSSGMLTGYVTVKNSTVQDLQVAGVGTESSESVYRMIVNPQTYEEIEL